jgi:hypothetical protein
MLAIDAASRSPHHIAPPTAIRRPTTGRAMTDDPDQEIPEPDPLDEAAAEIDARSPDAAEQIEELKEEAEDLGRDVEE